MWLVLSEKKNRIWVNWCINLYLGKLHPCTSTCAPASQRYSSPLDILKMSWTQKSDLYFPWDVHVLCCLMYMAQPLGRALWFFTSSPLPEKYFYQKFQYVWNFIKPRIFWFQNPDFTHPLQSCAELFLVRFSDLFSSAKWGLLSVLKNPRTIF